MKKLLILVALGFALTVGTVTVMTVARPISGPQVQQLPAPSNGVLRKQQGREALAPLRIETTSDHEYVFKVVNIQNSSEEMLLYVGRNSSYNTKVPFGTYHILGAFGDAWYGVA